MLGVITRRDERVIHSDHLVVQNHSLHIYTLFRSINPLNSNLFPTLLRVHLHFFQGKLGKLTCNDSVRYFSFTYYFHKYLLKCDDFQNNFQRVVQKLYNRYLCCHFQRDVRVQRVKLHNHFETIVIQRLNYLIQC